MMHLLIIPVMLMFNCGICAAEGKTAHFASSRESKKNLNFDDLIAQLVKADQQDDEVKKQVQIFTFQTPDLSIETAQTPNVGQNNKKHTRSLSTIGATPEKNHPYNLISALILRIEWQFKQKVDD